MMMVELTSVPAADLPIAALSDHLRLSSGFADDGSQDAQLETCLRAALAAIEARIKKALFERQFMLTLVAWSSPEGHPMPVAPVKRVDAITLIARDGTTRLIDADAYKVVQDAHRPHLMAVGASLPLPGLGGTVEIAFTAGYGSQWDGIPADLRLAVLSLAADFYDQQASAPRPVPAHVMEMIAPYRHLRLGRWA